MKKIAIIGGGIAGTTATYELAKQPNIEATLFEASPRLGGIVETVREGGFIIECGPDGWVTEKPWARDLAIELGLEEELLPSNDATRRTYILKDGTLQAIPDGLRMMVPTNLDALNQSPLFTESAKQAYRDEPSRAAEFMAHALKATTPVTDESVASFVRRHFGDEVLTTIAAPLLSGVFGGDVHTLSVRAVMAPFVAMERQYGSLILGLQARERATSPHSIFTSLKSGTATLIDRMVAAIPPHAIHRNTAIRAITRTGTGWTVQRSGPHNKPDTPPEHFDHLILATPADVTRDLLHPIDPQASFLLDLEASSAVIVAFAFPDAAAIPVPPGFGFLVPPASVPPPNPQASEAPTASRLLAATFTDQKYDHRVPAGARLLRAFFGGPTAERMMRCNNDEIAAIARLELARILGPLPEPQITIVRRWPRSLPQYAVGHLERMDSLHTRIALLPNLHLLGNPYRGVGLPDLVREATSIIRQLSI